MTGPKLTLVDGAGRSRVFVGAIEVVLAPIDQAPFAVDAVVEEEDQHLVLSAPPVIPERQEHPIRVMTAVWEDAPRELGRVVVHRGAPHRLLAVVHDLDREPSVDPSHVRAALATALETADVLGARALRLPLLGAVHGVLAPREGAGLVGAALRAFAPKHLARVWIVTSDPEGTADHL